MKPVTKERILNALEKVQKYTDAKPEINIIQAFAEIGLRSACGNPNPVPDKCYLELTYQGWNDPKKVLPRLSHLNLQTDITSKEALKEAWISSFKRTLEKKDARCEKILAIQKAHKISGLELRTDRLGDKIIKYHVPSWQLELLDSDREVMHRERQKIGRAFLNAVKSITLHNLRKKTMTLWVRSKGEVDDWLPTDGKTVVICSFGAMWAKCWEHRYFVNQQELRTKGHASLKSEYTSPHDEMFWELNLVVGNGLDPDSDTYSTWFCATLGEKKPSL